MVLARSGATILAEVAAFGLPSILVPYPFAADDHQTENAKIFSSRGAGWMMMQNNIEIERLAQRIADAVLQPERRRKMAMAALALAAPQSAVEIVDRLIELAQGERVAETVPVVEASAVDPVEKSEVKEVA